MGISEALQKYLTARFANDPTDDLRKALVAECEGQFEALRKARQPFDLHWYVNQRFIDGDHWLKLKTGSDGTGKVYNSDAADGADSKRIKRSINIMKAQIRGLKNFVLKIPLTVEISPEPQSEDPQELQAAQAEAKNKGVVWRALEEKLKLAELKRSVVDDGFVKHAGYLFVLPTTEGLPIVKWYDAFDVFPDTTAPTFYDGVLLALATRQNVRELKTNKDYENTDELKGDGKLAASTYKNSYEQQRMGTNQAQLMSGDLESVILKQMFVKLPLTIKTESDPATGQQQTKLVPTENGQTRIWIVSFTSAELHRVEETEFTRWPGLRYVPEQTGNGIHNKGWANDLKDPNKIVDNMLSKAEEWHIKASPKLLVPTDSKLKEVTDKIAEVLEYDPRKGDGIKDFMPSGAPNSMFTLIDRAQSFSADVGGMHPSSGGSVPVGVKSGRALESLQAADAEFNMAEPVENFAIMWQELVERVLETVAGNTTTPTTLPYDDNGITKKVTFIGQAGTKLQDGQPAPLPSGTVVVGRSRVKVRAVPAIGYTEDGRRETLLELRREGLVDPQTVLEAYRFSNVGEIVERVEAENQRKAQQPPPPKPVDGDRLLNALANLAKSGEPITLDQLNAAMQQAGLPPVQTPDPQSTSQTDAVQPTFDEPAAPVPQ